MNSDIGAPVNWMLVVLLLGIAAGWLITWSQPSTLRKIAARYLARADALDQSRFVYEKSLGRWNKRLGIPDPSPAPPRTSLEARRNDA